VLKSIATQVAPLVVCAMQDLSLARIHESPFADACGGIPTTSASNGNSSTVLILRIDGGNETSEEESMSTHRMAKNPSKQLSACSPGTITMISS
jgi:hypothetical protein